jgi:ferredoxin
MQEDTFTFHYVSTNDEARELVENYKRFWVSNCECREKRGTCHRSRIDVCLYFRDDINYFGSNFHEVSKTDVHEILKEAEKKHLVARPFRDEHDKDKTDGICFCCDDCCEYFIEPGHTCDKGKFIEETENEKCAQCGTCTDVCYFNARAMNDELTVIRENCYGCGLCVYVCPEACIHMVPRW